MSFIGIGTRSESTCLHDLPVRSPQGDALCLGHLVSYHDVILPAYVTDEGYVIVTKEAHRFSRLDAKTTAELQHRGVLPSPLPAYTMSSWNYVYGYSFWPMLLAMLLLVRRRRRMRARYGTVSAGTVPAGPPVAEGMARIEVQATHSPIAFHLALLTPVIEINSARHRRPWGVSSFDVAPGAYRVGVNYLSLMGFGSNQVELVVGPGETKRVTYHKGPTNFVPAAMKVHDALPAARVVK